MLGLKSIRVSKKGPQLISPHWRHCRLGMLKSNRVYPQNQDDIFIRCWNLKVVMLTALASLEPLNTVIRLTALNALVMIRQYRMTLQNVDMKCNKTPSCLHVTYIMIPQSPTKPTITISRSRKIMVVSSGRSIVYGLWDILAPSGQIFRNIQVLLYNAVVVVVVGGGGVGVVVVVVVVVSSCDEKMNIAIPETNRSPFY